MTNAISSWFKKYRAGRRKDQPPPKLPSERTHQLTPTPSHEALAFSSSGAVTESAFFQKLPVELRRSTLIEAFGGPVVQMDLNYDYPPSPHRSETADTDLQIAHCDMNMDWYGGKDGPQPRLDESQPKQWLWQSSVCHRNPPNPPLPGHTVPPSHDLCRIGQTGCNLCELWPGSFPLKCFIGAMGWLLTCRQAYLEGIDVLYSTNTIHTASKEVLMQLGELLLPQRISSINSVELLWEFDPFPRIQELPVRGPLSDMESFYRFLDAVPSMFPNVQRLYVSLQGLLHPTTVIDGRTNYNDRISTADNYIMKPVDDMVRKLGAHVLDCSVAIPSSLYAPQRDRTRDMGGQIEQAYLGGKLERH